jgi:hypothetical protein
MLRVLAVLTTLCLFHLPPLQAALARARGIAQEQSPPPDQNQDQQQYQQQDQQQDQGPAYENYSPEQLDNLLSPIALYPDPLLAQLFVAATFPDQVEEAARYVRGNGTNGVDDQDWDVSVRAIAHYPTVVQMMANKIDWTTSLGQAYVNQSTDVASSVQHLRHLARDTGNLQSSQQQEIIEHDNYLAISPYQPEYIYVPVYDPAIIYYQRPHWGPAITFGAGFPIGAWLNLDFRWGYGGGWGGVYYTGWRQEGWGGGCWNCGWIGRSRGRVNYNNSVYVNNRYNNINVNRNVLNRNVNANNLNRYNSVHRNVNYNNVQANNNRANRMNNGNNGRNGNASGNYGNNGRQNNAPGNSGNNGSNGRYGNSPSGNNRTGTNNKIIDRNIDRSNPQIDQYRGRDNNVRNDRPPGGQPQPMPGPAQRTDNRPNQQPQQSRPQYQQTQQSRPLYQQPQQNRPQYQQPQGGRGGQSQMTQPAPHSYNPREGNFDPRASSQRGQASRQQAPAQQRSAPPPRAQSRQDAAPRGSGGERRKP